MEANLLDGIDTTVTWRVETKRPMARESVVEEEDVPEYTPLQEVAIDTRSMPTPSQTQA
jgi:hypothetical protein